MDDIVFSITANLDLLVFSAHLSFGSGDVRTEIPLYKKIIDIFGQK